MHLRRAYRLPRVFQAGKAAAPKVHAFVPAALRSSQSPIAARVAFCPRRPLFEPTRESVQVVTRRDERTRSVTAHARIRQPELQVVRLRSLALNNVIPRSHDGTDSQVRLGHPPGLVWRRELRPPIGVANEEPSPGLPASFHRAPASAVPAPETTPAAPSLPARPATPQLASLEPALLDRLADDVIRRVERRVRIDRERRGL
jgi:hypothetical protein